MFHSPLLAPTAAAGPPMAGGSLLAPVYYTVEQWNADMLRNHVVTLARVEEERSCSFHFTSKASQHKEADLLESKDDWAWVRSGLLYALKNKGGGVCFLKLFDFFAPYI